MIHLFRTRVVGGEFEEESDSGEVFSTLILLFVEVRPVSAMTASDIEVW